MNTITKYCHNKFLANSEEIENTSNFDYLLKAIWTLSEKNEEGAYSLNRNNALKVVSQDYKRANYFVFKSYGCWHHVLSDYLYRTIKRRFADDENPPQLYKDVQYRFRINSTLEGLNSFVCPQLILDNISVGELATLKAGKYEVGFINNSVSHTELYNPSDKNLPVDFSSSYNLESAVLYEGKYYGTGDKLELKKGRNTLCIIPTKDKEIHYQNLLVLMPVNIKEVIIYGN